MAYQGLAVCICLLGGMSADKYNKTARFDSLVSRDSMVGVIPEEVGYDLARHSGDYIAISGALKSECMHMRV